MQIAKSRRTLRIKSDEGGGPERGAQRGSARNREVETPPPARQLRHPPFNLFDGPPRVPTLELFLETVELSLP